MLTKQPSRLQNASKNKAYDPPFWGHIYFLYFAAFCKLQKHIGGILRGGGGGGADPKLWADQLPVVEFITAVSLGIGSLCAHCESQ